MLFDFRRMEVYAFLLMHYLGGCENPVQEQVEKPAIMGRNFLSARKKSTPFCQHTMKSPKTNQWFVQFYLYIVITTWTTILTIYNVIPS